MERLTHRVDGRLRFVSDPPLLVPIEDLVAGRGAREIEAAIAVILRDYRATLQHDRRHLLTATGTRTWRGRSSASAASAHGHGSSSSSAATRRTPW